VSYGTAIKGISHYDKALIAKQEDNNDKMISLKSVIRQIFNKLRFLNAAHIYGYCHLGEQRRSSGEAT
jgi:hypothetical protein